MNTTANEVQPENLSVTLKMDESTKVTLNRHMSAVQMAQEFVIDSQAMAEIAAEERNNCKAAIKHIKGMYDGFVSPAKQIIENAKSLFKPPVEALEQAEKIFGDKLIAWTTKENARIAEEARVRAAAEMKARQEAEQKAAAERAKAEEKAAELRRQAEAQEEARQKALAEGNARAAAAAAAEAAKLAEKAESTLETGEHKAQDAFVAAAPTAPKAETNAKVAGLTVRKNWKAEPDLRFKDETAIKTEICKAIASGRTELLSLLDISYPKADKMAKALEENFNVPGLVAVNRPIAASKRA